jgi:hypothetical protein
VPEIQQFFLIITVVMMSVADTCSPSSSCRSASSIVVAAIAQLSDRLNRLNRHFNPFIEACLASIVPIDALTTVCLVRLRGEVHELTGHAEQVTASHYQRWIQVNTRRQPEER